MGDTNNEQKQQFIPLGRQLKRITEESKSSIEVKNFTDILVKAAQQGLDRYEFNDLRDVVPTMIINGTLFNWLNANELVASGVIDQNTGNYHYTISW